MERPSSISGVMPDRADGQRNARMVRHIGIALFNGFAPQEAITIGRAFQSANALSRSSRSGGAIYNVRLLSAPGGMIASSSSMIVWTESVEACHNGENFHALFIVGGMGAHDALGDERLVNWLRAAVPRCQLTFPIAEGRLLLEAAGIGLGDRGHPYGGGARSVARRCLEAASYASFVGPLRMALDVIEADLGAELTRQIAVDVVPPVETQFTAVVRKSADHFVSERIQASARWMLANVSCPIVIREAARAAAMSERNFLRRFKVEMGVTPSDYLMYARLDMCCRLLVETNLPVDKVAHRCGIGGGGRLSKLFRKHLAITPTAYRANSRCAASAVPQRAGADQNVNDTPAKIE
jgi:transcriptional regulator GlxA family with amidase domain